MSSVKQFMRDVINPIGLIVLIIFALGMMVDALGATPTRSEVVPTTEQAFPNVKTIDEIFGDNGAAFSAQIAKIDKLEAVINSRQELRDLYHGGKPVQVITTNLETRIIQRQDKYPDGYIHIEKAWERKIPTAEQLANRKVQRATSKQTRINALKTRIETLQTNSNPYAQMQLEAARRTLKRLENASTTNYVDITITPQTGGANVR